MGIAADLSILTPKRDRRLQVGWEGFFPYYAGYPEVFASELLKSASLSPGAAVLDPWNGSGTTIYAASLLGFRGLGIDINPAMVVVARARLLSPTEADSLAPLGIEIVKVSRDREGIIPSDPLLQWFDKKTAATIRSIERSIASHLTGGSSGTTVNSIERLSHFASANYVALFAVCRTLASKFYSSNPTWIRVKREGERALRFSRKRIEADFIRQLSLMAAALLQRSHHGELSLSEVSLGNSAGGMLGDETIDFVLSSPPYCTRIDYTAATKVELALIAPMVQTRLGDLSRAMLGSIRVPVHEIEVDAIWGDKCKAFLAKMKAHPSKASSGYYLRTHLDYFDKLTRSVGSVSRAMKKGATAVFVVQDSFYKDVHNDLPSIVAEIAQGQGLRFSRKEDFYSSRSMSGINRNSRLYNRRSGAVESVLCFEK